MSHLEKLNEILMTAKNAPFYQNRIPQLPLTSISQLTQLPLTFKEDLSNYSPNGFIAVPPEELFQYHESSGTTGKPVSTWMTKDDFYKNVDQLTRSGVHFHNRDIVLVRFPYALTTISHLLHAAAQQQQACVIPASARTSVCPMPRTIELMKKLKVTILCCNSLQGLMLADTAKLLGYNPAEDFSSLRAICTAGEPLTPGRRKLLEETWNVRVFDFFGMTEIGNVAVDCLYGRLHVMEEDFLIELLDETYEKEVSPGTSGNLVVTALYKKGTPMIRYVTHDRAVYDNSPCPCGRNYSLKHLGRKTDVIPIKDRHLDLWELDELLMKLPNHRFWVAGPLDSKVKVVLEVEPSIVNEDKNDLGSNDWLIVETVPPGTLYGQDDFLSVGLTSKPKYLFSEDEMKRKAYLR